MFASVLAWGCASDGPRLDGESCGLDEECTTGLCEGVCLDPEGDTDGDGLSNGRERTLGLNPLAADTDGDGFADGLEFEADSDADGKSDAIESAFSDRDGDCVVDSLDADDATANKDLRAVAALMCRNRGLCSGAIRPVAACVAGALSCDYSALAAWEGEVELSCDGLDNDCDGETDEHFVYIDSMFSVATIGDACFGVGACAELAGVVHCDGSGRAALCSVNAGGERYAGASFDLNCDGIDNDCDGDTDEEIVWADPLDGALLSAGSLCRADGACGLTFGVVECAPNGETGLCSTGPGGTADKSHPEACNGLDDDCDGDIDEDVGLDVAGGDRVPLGGRCGVGVCDGGQVVCGADGSVRCSTAARMTPEICNGLDDDCDGEADELGDVRQACPAAGICAQSSLLSGRCDGASLVCRYEDGATWRSGQAEVRCDQRDDDCDGLTDEDFATISGRPAGSACVGVGACLGAVGVVVCADSGLSVVCDANDYGTPEVCDGLDNDCSGLVDDGPLADADACHGVGVCGPTAGPEGACEDGRWRCAWEAAVDYQSAGETRCDGLDNDCDGWTDEELRGQVTGASVAVAAAVLSPGLNGQLVAGPAGEPWLWSEDSEGYGEFWRWAADRFEVVASTRGPLVGVGQAVVWDPSRARWWVHGGAQGSGDVWLFDPVTRAWTSASAPDAVKRQGHVLVPLGGGAMFVHGGIDTTTGLGAPPALWVYETGPGAVSLAQGPVPPGLSDAPALKWHRAAVVVMGAATWLVMVGTPSYMVGAETSPTVGAMWPLVMDSDSGRLTPTGPAMLLRADAGRIPRRPGLWFARREAGLSVNLLGHDAVLRWQDGAFTAAVTAHATAVCADGALGTQPAASATVLLHLGQCRASESQRWAGESLHFDDPSAGAVASALSSPWRQPVAEAPMALRSTHEDAVLAFAAGAPDRLWRWAGAGWERWSLAVPSVGPAPTSADIGQFLARGGVEDGWWYATLEDGTITLWTLVPTGSETAEWGYVARHVLAPATAGGELAGIGLTAAGEPWFMVAPPAGDVGGPNVLLGWDGAAWIEVTGGAGFAVAGYADGNSLRLIAVDPAAPSWTLWGIEGPSAANATMRAVAVGELPAADRPSARGVGVASQRAVFAWSVRGRMLRWSTGAEPSVGVSGSLDADASVVNSWAWVESSGLLSTHARGSASLRAWPTSCITAP